MKREADDKRLQDAERWRRYRCRNQACGWEGLLQVSRRRRIKLEPVGHVRRGLRLAGISLALAVVVVLGWGAFQVVQGLFEN